MPLRHPGNIFLLYRDQSVTASTNQHYEALRRSSMTKFGGVLVHQIKNEMPSQEPC